MFHDALLHSFDRAKFPTRRIGEQARGAGAFKRRTRAVIGRPDEQRPAARRPVTCPAFYSPSRWTGPLRSNRWLTSHLILRTILATL